MQYTIIIPCYNEAENVENLIKRILPLQEKYEIEYVLVENGSKDNSRDFFHKNVEGCYKNISVVYVDNNQGYGYGIQQGLKAATGDYVGWIHADLQMPPEELIQFFEQIERNDCPDKLFMKGKRTNRSAFDRFFTNGQSIFNSMLFGMKIYDVGAIPVLFSRSLLEEICIDDMPNDFSLELYVYKEATRLNYKIERFEVRLLDREKGASSWNKGIKSKLFWSKRIIRDSISIWKGKKVY